MSDSNKPGEVRLDGVRTSFLHVFKARGFNNGGEPKFSGKFMIPKSDKAQIEKVKAAMRQIRDAEWKVDPKLKADKLCLQDGDAEGSRDEYAGHMILSASNKKRPMVIDRNRTPLTEADGKPYSGCYVNAVIRIWAQDNDYGKRINASLEGVQFSKDGEAFSGADPLSEDAFDDLSDGEFTDSGSSADSSSDDSLI